MFDSTSIIGHNIYLKAKVHYVFVTTEAQFQSVLLQKWLTLWYCPLQELYANAAEEVTGPVQFAHQWVNMTDVTVKINDTHTVRRHT